MSENILFAPEGLRPQPSFSLSVLQDAMKNQTILEAPVQRCDTQKALHIPLGGIAGIMPREEVLAPWISGAHREIAVLSRVGKPTCFTVTAITADARGAPVASLSRRIVQERAMEFFLERLQPGSIVTARVTHLASFGAFLDIGCGIIAMLPIEQISVSRIAHPGDRFRVGQQIRAAVLSADRKNRRFVMTHRELLGTWMENASLFRAGETVRGTVRSVMDYGSFIELTPNLSGLADNTQPLCCGEAVSVFVKSLQPERMKIKLQLIERLGPAADPAPLRYWVTDGPLERWVYSPPNCRRKSVETVFTAACP